MANDHGPNGGPLSFPTCGVHSCQSSKWISSKLPSVSTFWSPPCPAASPSSQSCRSPQVEIFHMDPRCLGRRVTNNSRPLDFLPLCIRQAGTSHEPRMGFLHTSEPSCISAFLTRLNLAARPHRLRPTRNHRRPSRLDGWRASTDSTGNLCSIVRTEIMAPLRVSSWLPRSGLPMP